MPEVERAPEGLVIVADADVWCKPAAVEAAITAVAIDGCSWARPHQRVVRLGAAATRRWLHGETAPDETVELDRRPYRGEDGGGIIVTTRARLLEAPLDRRFRGWGQEDSALGAAFEVLYGRPWVGRATLYHLHHRPAPRLTQRKGSEANWSLWLDYARARARNDPVAMRRLLAEAWIPQPSAKQSPSFGAFRPEPAAPMAASS